MHSLIYFIREAFKGFHRHLSTAVGSIITIFLSLLIIGDASRAPELFAKSAQVYVRMTEEDVLGKSAYIKAFHVEDLDYFKAMEEKTEEA